MFPFPNIDLEAGASIPEMDREPKLAFDGQTQLRVQKHQGSGRLAFTPGAVEVASASKVHVAGLTLINIYSSLDDVDMLRDEPILNANVLDCLLANQHLIPEEWKGKRVHFLGTIFARRYDGWNYPHSRFMEWVPWKKEWVSRLLHWDERVGCNDLVALHHSTPRLAC